MAASSRLTVGLLRLANTGTWQTRNLQTLSCSNIKSLQLFQQSTQRLSSKVISLQCNQLLMLPKVQHNSLNLEINRNFASTSKADVESRVLAVCKAFDKITADKLTMESHFINDLGLDSLDHVEVIMAIEDEFGFEIPDDHAEKLLTPVKIVEYVAEHENIKT